MYRSSPFHSTWNTNDITALGMCRVYRSSPFRSTWNTNGFAALGMWKVCTEAAHFDHERDDSNTKTRKHVKRENAKTLKRQDWTCKHENAKRRKRKNTKTARSLLVFWFSCFGGCTFLVRSLFFRSWRFSNIGPLELMMKVILLFYINRGSPKTKLCP